MTKQFYSQFLRLNELNVKSTTTEIDQIYAGFILNVAKETAVVTFYNQITAF